MTGAVSGRARWRGAGVCAGVAVAFVVLGWLGVRDKSATVDEPMVAVAGFAAARDGEYRVSPDTPPLSEYWAMAAEPRDALGMSYSGRAWEDLVAGRGAWGWANRVYFGAGPARADAFLARARGMMLLLGAVVVVVTARWGWEMGGPVAGVLAGGLVAFDPNFLGNAPLVKSDVALVLCFVAACWGAWRVGRRVTWGWVAATALAAGAGPATKYPGIALPAILAGLMVARATLPGAWRVGRREVGGWGKAAVAGALCVAWGVGFLVVVWGTFRFHSGRMGGLAEGKDVVGRVALAMGRAGVVPEAWAGGLAQQRAQAGEWPAYLMGQFSRTGWRDYFLWAAAFKEPVGTLVGMVVAGGVVWALRRRVGAGRGWDAVCLVVPAGVYGVAAMMSAVNAGFRHFLVVMPFVYVGVGVVAGVALRVWGRRAGWVMGGLGAAVVVEVVLGCPDYIAFFNWPARAYGPVKLLADSNLDWGQDLKGLVEWQKAHPDVPLYVCYFGVTRPEFYGLRYEPLPGWPLEVGAEPAMPAGEGVAAISATAMQGIYGYGVWGQAYRGLMGVKPMGVIGGTIYLYDMGVVRRVVGAERNVKRET